MLLAELKELEDQLAANPHDARVVCLRALCLERLQQPQEALETYDKAAELDPELPLAWSGLGATLTKLGRLDEAL
ncbi:MAG: tetratricopeptide repeat protein, partial [Candidatus Dormibacteria bacterium]